MTRLGTLSELIVTAKIKYMYLRRGRLGRLGLTRVSIRYFVSESVRTVVPALVGTTSLREGKLYPFGCPHIIKHGVSGLVGEQLLRTDQGIL